MYINSKKKSKARISVWGLVFLLILTLTLQIFTANAYAKGIVNGIRNAETDAGDMARDAGNKIEEAVSDVVDTKEVSNGKTEDSDGIIGNESAEETRTDTAQTRGEKAGIITVIVLIVAAIIAVIVIVTLLTKKKTDPND